LSYLDSGAQFYAKDMEFIFDFCKLLKGSVYLTKKKIKKQKSVKDVLYVNHLNFNTWIQTSSTSNESLDRSARYICMLKVRAYRNLTTLLHPSYSPHPPLLFSLSTPLILSLQLGPLASPPTNSPPSPPSRTY
jgi:hypothetical protein